MSPYNVVTLRDRYGYDADADIIGAHELTNAAGITYRQLDFWTRAGYLTALPRSKTASSGSPRAYTLDQLTLARQMARLVAIGLPPGVAVGVAADLIATGTARLGDFTLTPRQEPT